MICEAESGQRFYWSERQYDLREILRSADAVDLDDETYAEWLTVWDGVVEAMPVAVALPPPEKRSRRADGSWRRLDLEWFVFVLPSYGLPVIGWESVPCPSRPERWVRRLRFVDGHPDTPMVMRRIEEDLRELGATEPPERIMRALREDYPDEPWGDDEPDGDREPWWRRLWMPGIGIGAFAAGAAFGQAEGAGEVVAALFVAAVGLVAGAMPLFRR